MEKWFTCSQFKGRGVRRNIHGAASGYMSGRSPQLERGSAPDRSEFWHTLQDLDNVQKL